MRFTRGDVRDPYRFIQNRSRISVVALKRDAAAEKPKDQLSRDFLGCSIFDFCNNIGAKRLFSCGLTWATPSPRWQVNVHPASSPPAFRRITSGGCPKAPRKSPP